MSRLARLLGLPDGVKAEYVPEQWQASGPGTTIAYYDSTFSTYLKVYRAQPAVRQVVSFIAENMAQVPVKTYQRVSDVERKHLEDHAVDRALQAPNTETSAFEFMRDLVTDLEVFDVSFHQIVRRTRNGQQVITLARMFPDAVELRDFSPLGPQTFRYHKGDGTYKDLARQDVLYVRGYGDARGISPLETLRNILAEDYAAGQYREGMYRNGMRNAGVIERPLEAPDWSDKARKRFIEQLVNRHTGANSTGRPLLLEEGMTWKSDQIATRSEEYIAGRELTVKAVANLYRVSPQIMGLSDAPYASITEYNRQLYQNVLAPRMTHVTQALERQLLTLDERQTDKMYLEFNLSAKLRGSFAEQAAIGSMAVGQPWMTVGEWRAVMDLAPLDEAELEALSQQGAAQPAAPGPDTTGAGETDAPAPSQDSPVEAVDEPKAADPAPTLGKTFARMSKAYDASGTVDVKRFARELAQDLKQDPAPWHADIVREAKAVLEAAESETTRSAALADLTGKRP